MSEDEEASGPPPALADDALPDTAMLDSEQLNSEAFLEALENRYVQLQQEKDALETAVAEKDSTIQDLRVSQQDMQQSLLTKETELAEAQRESLIYKETGETIQSENQTKQERMDRMQAEADTLRAEISRLTERNAVSTERIAELETMSKLSESEAVPLQYEVNRTRKELDSLSSHTQWLETELEDRNNKLMSLQQKHSAELMETRQSLDRATEGRDEAARMLSKVELYNETLQRQLEQTSTELKDSKQEAATAVESSQTELVQERRLVDLQKEQLDRLRTKYDDAVKELESQRSLAREASTKTQEQVAALESELKEASERVLQEQASNFEQQLGALQTQVEEAVRKRQEAEDGLLNAPRHRIVGASIAENPDRLLGAAEGDEEPLSLTDLYERLSQTEDELRAEKKETMTLRLMLDKIHADIAARTPKMVRQRQEYERAMMEADEARGRLKEALTEVNSFRQENRELNIEKTELTSKNRELQQESRDLAKQVQALLRSRAGEDPGEGIPVSVADIQTQNQTLLQEHRRLSNDLSDLREQLRTDPLKIRCEKAERERDTLRENEKRQETLVAGIVQQRDLYRALLAKHDTALINESTTEIIEAQSEKTKKLEELKISLETDLAKAMTELNAANNGKEVLEQRAARYEAHTSELTSSVDKLQAQLASAMADIARSEADAGYHRNKCTRLEESLQLARDESIRIQDAKDQMQTVNGELQQTVANANSQVMQLEHELRQVQRKLNLSEAQVQTAKASESRLTQEVAQLRNDVARQGALLESVQRIEASLSAKSAEQTDALKEEVGRLMQRIDTEQSKHSLESESLSGRVRELEADLKELDSKREAAVASMVKAKEESASTMARMKSLESRCNQQELELRSTKKKLGENNETEEENPEAELQNKVDSLTTDLEEVRSELATTLQRVEDYQKIAKASEDALVDLTRSTNEYKNAKDTEVEELKKTIDSLKADSESKQEVIVDLTKDLSSQRGEQDKVVAEIKGKVTHLEEEATALRKDAEAATSRASAIEAEIATYRSEAIAAQNNYERELNLHSTARTDLRKAREDTETEIRLRKISEEQLDSLRLEIEEKGRMWLEERSALQTTVKNLEKSLEESRAQSDVLHSQLATLGDQVERSQSERIDAATEEGSVLDTEEVGALRKTITELREVVRFLRSEREVSQAQVDAARRTAEREKAATVVTRRSLEEARAELKVLRDRHVASSVEPSERDDATLTSLKAAEDQLTLLRESNKLLRDETVVLKTSVGALKSELDATKVSMAPNEKKQRELEVEKVALEAEKASLLREIEAWKGRVHSLVSKFHQIDPEDHKKALEKVEDLSKQFDEAESQKAGAQKELSSAKTLISRMNKDLAAQKTLVETHKKMVLKMQSAASSKASAEVVKERNELKQKINQLEESSKSTKTELDGANQRIEGLKNHLRNFQKQILDLRKKNSELEKAARAPTASARSTASDKATETQGEAARKASPPTATRPTPDETRGVVAAETSEDERKTENVAFTQALVQKKPLPTLPIGGFKFGPGSTESSKSDAPGADGPPKALSDPAKGEKEKSVAETETQRPVEATKTMSAEDKIRERLLQRKRKALEGLEKAKGSKSIKATGATESKPAENSLEPSEENVAKEPEMATVPPAPVPTPSTPSNLSVAAAPFKPSSVPTEPEATAREDAVSGEKPAVEVPVSQADEESAPAEEFKDDDQGEPEVPSSEATGDVSTEEGEQTSSVNATEEGNGEGESTKEQAKPAAFGSSTTFGSGFGGSAAPFGGGAFGSAAPSGFGSSKTSGEASFGSGSSFLDMKPPGSSSAPFSFGSSPNIKLPLPAMGAPVPSKTTFGSFGGGVAPSASKTAFGGASQTHQPLFGSSAGTKSPAPENDDTEQADEAKEPHIEEDDEGEGDAEGDTIEADDAEDDDEEYEGDETGGDEEAENGEEDENEQEAEE